MGRLMSCMVAFCLISGCTTRIAYEPTRADTPLELRVSLAEEVGPESPEDAWDRWLYVELCNVSDEPVVVDKRGMDPTRFGIYVRDSWNNPVPRFEIEPGLSFDADRDLVTLAPGKSMSLTLHLSHYNAADETDVLHPPFFILTRYYTPSDTPQETGAFQGVVEGNVLMFRPEE